MKTFKHIHSSGRFDRSEASVKAAVRSYVSRDASILTFTEFASESRERILSSIGGELGYRLVSGDLSSRDDCAILFSDAWRPLYTGTSPVLSSGSYYTARGRPVGTFGAANAVLLDVTTGKRLLVSVAHLPPSVEKGGGLLGVSRRVAAWRKQQKAWKRTWNVLAKRYHVDAILIVADWNVDIKKVGFRSLLRGLQPGMKLAWGNGPFPKGGTHGRRLIDFSFYRGAIKPQGLPYLLPDDNSSDHRPYAESFNWK